VRGPNTCGLRHLKHTWFCLSCGNIEEHGAPCSLPGGHTTSDAPTLFRPPKLSGATWEDIRVLSAVHNDHFCLFTTSVSIPGDSGTVRPLSERAKLRWRICLGPLHRTQPEPIFGAALSVGNFSRRRAYSSAPPRKDLQFHTPDMPWQKHPRATTHAMFAIVVNRSCIKCTRFVVGRRLRQHYINCIGDRTPNGMEKFASSTQETLPTHHWHCRKPSARFC
jgi:hypothetical protein